MEGIVVCIKRSVRIPLFYIVGISGNGPLCIAESSINAGLGELVSVENGGIARVIEGAAKAQDLYSRLISISLEKAKRSLSASPGSIGISDIDAATERMRPALESAALLLLKKLLLGAPILIRFHNDADGSSGAYAIYSGMKAFLNERKANAVWIMHKGVAYSAYDAESDRLILNGYESLERPLILIIDFGTSADSNAGAEKALAYADVIWLDHHPVPEGFEGMKAQHYINPWLFGSDSNYTAGLLSSMLARLFSKSPSHEMECASLVGDHSAYTVACSEGRDLATLLDLITSDARVTGLSTAWDITPQYIEGILNNRQRYDELLKYAKVRLDDTTNLALKRLKVYDAHDSKIFLLDFDDVRDDNTGFPLPGRFATRLMDTIAGLNPAGGILILHINQYISIRLSPGLEKRIGILGIINELKERYGAGVESGGGHSNAASIKVSATGEKRAVLHDLIALAKKSLG